MFARPSHQRRSQEKRARILKALEVLLRHRAFSGIAVLDVAQAAGVPAATLYQRFHGPDVMGSILLALYFECVESWASRAHRAQPAFASLREMLEAVAADAWDMVQEHGHVMRPAYLHSRQYPHGTGPEWHRLDRVAEAGFRAFLRERASTLPRQDLDESARVLCLLYNSMLLGPLLHGEDARWSAPEARSHFCSMLADLAERYLSGPR